MTEDELKLIEQDYQRGCDAYDSQRITVSMSDAFHSIPDLIAEVRRLRDQNAKEVVKAIFTVLDI